MQQCMLMCKHIFSSVSSVRSSSRLSSVSSLSSVCKCKQCQKFNWRRYLYLWWEGLWSDAWTGDLACLGCFWSLKSRELTAIHGKLRAPYQTSSQWTRQTTKSPRTWTPLLPYWLKSLHVIWLKCSFYLKIVHAFCWIGVLTDLM